MLHQNSKNVNLRCACCLRWIDTGKEQAYTDKDDTHALCVRCLPRAAQDASLIKANIQRCPKPPKVNTPTIGEIRQMLRSAGLPSHTGAVLLLIEGLRSGMPASVLYGVLVGGAA